MSSGMVFDGQVFCSTADNEGVAAQLEDAALSERLDLTVGMQTWSVSDYCARYWKRLDARLLAGMFSDVRSKRMLIVAAFVSKRILALGSDVAR